MTKRQLKALLGGLIGIILTAFFIFYFTNIGAQFLKGLEARISNKDGSTSIHLALLEIALKGIFDNPINFLKGYGFGSSFLYTKEFFLGHKYGNFHSELLTIQFETGIIGLLLFILLLLLPILQPMVSRRISANLYTLLIIPFILLAGIFYQQYLFQYYWVMIGFIWVLPSIREQITTEDCFHDLR